MPKYVVERQYLIPVYQRLAIEADTVEEACEKAIDRGNWEDAVEDGDGARPTTITSTIHSDVPMHFAETLDT